MYLAEDASASAGLIAAIALSSLQINIAYRMVAPLDSVSGSHQRRTRTAEIDTPPELRCEDSSEESFQRRAERVGPRGDWATGHRASTARITPRAGAPPSARR